MAELQKVNVYKCDPFSWLDEFGGFTFTWEENKFTDMKSYNTAYFSVHSFEEQYIFIPGYKRRKPFSGKTR